MTQRTTPSPPPRPLPAHVTTPLLVRLTQETLDEDYRLTAERRAAAGAEPPARPGHPALLAGVLAIGLLIAVAAVQTRRNADVAATGRARLIEKITAEKQRVAEQQQRIADLRDDNAHLEASRTEQRRQDRDLRSRLTAERTVTGFGPINGPGVVLTFDNGSGSEVLQDSDLTLVVDGLWSVGAEAIAINDQRLTALSPIRNTGNAIQVNRRPLRPPYRIAAIGNPQTMAADWSETVQGAAVLELVDRYGFVFSSEQNRMLNLPAAPLRTLSHVRPADTPPGGDEPGGPRGKTGASTETKSTEDKERSGS